MCLLSMVFIHGNPIIIIIIHSRCQNTGKQHRDRIILDQKTRLRFNDITKSMARLRTGTQDTTGTNRQTNQELNTIMTQQGEDRGGGKTEIKTKCMWICKQIMTGSKYGTKPRSSAIHAGSHDTHTDGELMTDCTPLNCTCVPVFGCCFLVLSPPSSCFPCYVHLFLVSPKVVLCVCIVKSESCFLCSTVLSSLCLALLPPPRR